LQKLIKKFGLQGQENEYVQFYPDRAFNDRRYSIDSTKLTELGWEPVVDFDEGLDKTVEWYNKNFNNWSSAESALVPHPILQLSTTY